MRFLARVVLFPSVFVVAAFVVHVDRVDAKNRPTEVIGTGPGGEVSVDDAGGSLSVDDNGRSLTVDGTVKNMPIPPMTDFLDFFFGVFDDEEADEIHKSVEHDIVIHTIDLIMSQLELPPNDVCFVSFDVGARSMTARFVTDDNATSARTAYAQNLRVEPGVFVGAGQPFGITVNLIGAVGACQGQVVYFYEVLTD